jgi:hypothetical protein
MRDFGRFFGSDVLTIEKNRPLRGDQKLGQQIEYCGFARAIGANQRVNLASPDFEIDSVNCHKTQELFDQVLGLQNDVICHRVPRRSKKLAKLKMTDFVTYPRYFSHGYPAFCLRSDE